MLVALSPNTSRARVEANREAPVLLAVIKESKTPSSIISPKFQDRFDSSPLPKHNFTEALELYEQFVRLAVRPHNQKGQEEKNNLLKNIAQLKQDLKQVRNKPIPELRAEFAKYQMRFTNAANKVIDPATGKLEAKEQAKLFDQATQALLQLQYSAEIIIKTEGTLALIDSFRPSVNNGIKDTIQGTIAILKAHEEQLHDPSKSKVWEELKSQTGANFDILTKVHGLEYWLNKDVNILEENSNIQAQDLAKYREISIKVLHAYDLGKQRKETVSLLQDWIKARQTLFNTAKAKNPESAEKLELYIRDNMINEAKPENLEILKK